MHTREAPDTMNCTFPLMLIVCEYVSLCFDSVIIQLITILILLAVLICYTNHVNNHNIITMLKL